MGQELLSWSYIQADETTVGVQMHDGRGKIIRLTSGNTADRRDPWCLTFGWVGNGKGRSGSWATFEGILQSDGYGAYDHIGGMQIVHGACWAHARRKFFEAAKLNPQDQTSIWIVAQLNELFAIDALARLKGLSQMDRHALRLDKSKPLLEQLKVEIQAARVPPLGAPEF